MSAVVCAVVCAVVSMSAVVSVVVSVVVCAVVSVVVCAGVSGAAQWVMDCVCVPAFCVLVERQEVCIRCNSPWRAGLDRQTQTGLQQRSDTGQGRHPWRSQPAPPPVPSPTAAPAASCLRFPPSGGRGPVSRGAAACPCRVGVPRCAPLRVPPPAAAHGAVASLGWLRMRQL